MTTFLLIGPFGALATMQYGLTAAPASQPRNAVMGQAVAGAVSLGFTCIPESIFGSMVATRNGTGRRHCDRDKACIYASSCRCSRGAICIWKVQLCLLCVGGFVFGHFDHHSNGGQQYEHPASISNVLELFTSGVAQRSSRSKN
jgi:hypothetical protein